MLTAKTIIAAFAVGLLAGTVCALWVTVADAQTVMAPEVTGPASSVAGQ